MQTQVQNRTGLLFAEFIYTRRKNFVAFFGQLNQGPNVLNRPISVHQLFPRNSRIISIPDQFNHFIYIGHCNRKTN